VQVRQGRLNFTTMADIREGAPVLTGIFSVLNYPAIILFDSSASHSFIRTKFSAKCQLPFHHTNEGITIFVAEPPELFQLKCLSHASGVVTHLNRNNPSVPQI
jgi:hypothetical protein